MEIVPISDKPEHSPDVYGWKVPPSYSPSICLAFARDEDGVERPLIYSLERQAWLIADLNSTAAELPKKEQQIVGRLLRKNLQAYHDAIAGIRTGKTKVMEAKNDDQN